jgi:uncharacterized repeat protein (TIGR03806 family)
VHPPRLLHLKRLLLLGSILFHGMASTAGAASSGLDAPQPVGPYFNGVFPASPPGDPSGWAVVNAFPSLTFTDPMMLSEIPGSGDLLVVGKTGLIWRFPNNPAATMAQRVQVLDLTALTETSEDQGFYSLSFHPNFGDAGQPGENSVYVCYSRRAFPGVDDNDRTYWTVSRFTWLPGSGTIDPNSELVLMSQYDPHRYHNGGATFFGSDGFLYITVGDGGDGGDSFDNSQKINLGLFGGILRIDVDNDPAKSHPIRRQPTENPLWAMNPKPAGWPVSYTQGYGIPNDNPWLDPGGSVLEEFYAIGLRSPHSAHYDPVTGEIWVGDVGQSNREELSRIPKGGNCQWAYLEGTRALSKQKPSPLIGTDIVPEHEYDHSEGASIIGGMRYRGTKWDAFLGGKVIFGDHVRGRIWSLGLPAPGGVKTVTELYSSFRTGYKAGLSNFSTDSAGEIYMMDLGGNGNPTGRIMKLAVPAITAEPPQFLSQTGVFSNMASMATAAGVIPYDVPNPLWSDNAEKKRWVILPNDGSFNSAAEDVIFSAGGSWVFPAGTVFVKHFEAPLDAGNPSALKRLETRFLVCTPGGGKYGFTYKWNSAGTDAELLEGSINEPYDYINGQGGTESRVWSYPSRGDCMVCHNEVSGQALGVKTAHLNSDIYYPLTGRTANQLETLNALGVFSTTLTADDLEDYIEARALDDESAPLEHRIRSYLDTNCSHCHQPGAQGDGFDARISTPLDLQNLINAIPQRYEELGPDGRYIKPGNTALSAIHVRANAVGDGDAMPPLAKNMAHGEGIDALEDYINGLVPSEFNVTPAPKARYVRLRSLAGTRTYASVRELKILDGNGVPIPFGQLTIHDFDSQAGTNSGAAARAIDGSIGSSNQWQTPTSSNGGTNHPHYITIDLGSLREFGGFIYYPRGNNADGRISQYEVHYSENASDWTLFTSGTWPTNSNAEITYDPLFNKRPARAQIAGPAGTIQGAFEATVVFDMNVTDFTAADLQVTGGSVSKIRGSGYYYVARILPAPGAAQITVSVAEDAVNPEGLGSFPSQTANITVLPDGEAPAIPANLAGSTLVTSAQISWNASTDNVAVEGYRVLLNGQVIATTGNLSFGITGLDPLTAYSVAVVAFDATGNSSPAVPITLTTLPDTSAPSSPGGLAGVRQLTSIQLAWTASNDNVAVDAYRIRRNGDIVATVQGLGFQDTGLAVNTSYNYEVTAIDEAGNISNPALLTISTLPDLAPPEVPGSLGGLPDVTTVSLSWTAASDNVAVSSYRILREGFDIASVQGLTYLDTGLTPETTHNYQVIAVDSSGNLSLPASLAVTTLEDLSPPSTPANFTAEPGQSSVLLSWTSSNDNVAVDSYRIRRNGFVVATVQGLFFNDTGLDTNTVYNYEIIALDEADNASEPATLSTSTTSDEDPPSIPGSLAGEADYYSVSLSWTASTDSSPITGYEIRRNGAVVATVPGLSYTDIDLPGGVAQNYEVRAIDQAGNVSLPASLTISTIEFEDWLDDHGLAGQIAADSDGGGLDNLTEFQLGLDPLDSADDLGFRLECEPQGADMLILYPELKPVGHFHLHMSDSLHDLTNPANRIGTLTPAQIRAMVPAERSDHSVVVPTPGPRAFFTLVFEPLVD